MALNDALRDGEPQTRAVFLGGEERFEEAVEIFRGDARAIVRDGDAHVRSADRAGVRGERDDFSGHGEFARRPHGFDGVEQKIYEGLLQLVIVAFDRVGGGVEFTVKGNLFADELGLHGVQ